MATNLQVTGNVRDRFVQAATLLYLLDPVRGDPTAYGLDQESRSVQEPRELLLKRKFLDSFALICATRKDGDTVSAACLEEGGPEGTVVRIASNAGVTEETQSYLREILCTLSKISIKVLDTINGEKEILLKIIKLDMAKIRVYLKELQKAKKLPDESIPAIELRLSKVIPGLAWPPIQDFLDWIEQIFSIKDLPTAPDLDVVLGWITWARQAREFYLGFLKAAFANNNQSLPRWVCIILKLGRYSIATRALVQTACEIPALFDAIVVKAIPAPNKAQFSLRDVGKPLTCALSRVPEIKAEEVVADLARIWNTADAEHFFRESCPGDLVAHAELQMVNFYDHNPHLKPRIRFIGISKKACYLCSVFLSTHPENFYFSSCHQKLYLSWIPPPAMDYKVYKVYRGITTDMSKRMETIARQELLDRLRLRRSPVPADSTAGISFSGFTEWRKLGALQVEEYAEIETILESSTGVGESHIISQTRDTDSQIFSSAKAVSLIPQSSGSQTVSTTELDLPNSRQQSLRRECLLSSMVFHFKHLHDERKQDIIAVRTVLDPHTHSPSWSKLVELLNTDESLGLVYKDTDIMVVNKHIRVRNERQFTACLQYLQNSGILNSEVLICDSGLVFQISSDN